MFLGHAAAGLAAKAAAPRLSLGWLVAAAYLLDLLRPVFLLLGWEVVRIDPGNTAVTPLDSVSYPISHSLVAVILWAALCGLLVAGPGRARDGLVVACVVASHWCLDALTHRPDLPLTPGGSARVGLGLWNSVPGTLAAEFGLLAIGAWIYARRTRAIDRAGVRGFVSFLAVLIVIAIGNFAGPPPPSPGAIAVVGLLLWLLPIWAGWFDRHRSGGVAAR
jgi:hypothetical protein